MKQFVLGLHLHLDASAGSTKRPQVDTQAMLNCCIRMHGRKDKLIATPTEMCKGERFVAINFHS